jgi:hypothetical protein
MSQSNAQRAEPIEQEGTAPATAGKRPAATVRAENVEGAIWANQGSNGTFHSVTFSRKYKGDDDKIHNSDSFGPSDLLALKEAAGMAYAKVQELRQSKGQSR